MKTMTIAERTAKNYFEDLGRRPYDYREFIEAEQPGLDDTVTTEDLMFLMPETLNREIITLAEDARIGRNFVDVLRVNGPVESFLKEYGFAAAVVAEGAEIPLGKVRHEKLILTVFKVGVRPQLTYEAIADGKIPILQRNIKQAVLAMARFEDAHIMTVLNAGVPDGSAIVGTNESDHSFAAAATSLTWDDLVKCYTAIVREHLTPTDIIVHPYQIAQLLKMTEFRQVVAVGETPAAAVQPQFAMWNARMEARYGSGKIGTILGCQVWFTNNQTAGILLMIDKGNYAILAERQPMLTESDRDIIHQMQTVAFSQRYSAGILNNDGASNITALASTMP